MPSISAQKRNGNIVGYSVYLGTEGDERRVRKFFPKLPDAEKFIAERTQSPVPVGELWEKRMEILYNLDRLRSVGTTLTEVVSFYLNNRVGPSSLKLTEVLEKFLTEKKQVGRSPNYEHRMRYRRVSTTRQGQSGLGLESQDETVRRYVKSQNGTVVGEFVEVESGKNNDRPQLTLALQECRRQKATLVVAKLDRLSRNAEFLLRLQNGNVDFVCCDCPNVDRFTVGILALVAQRERELISERTKSALAQARKRGVRLGTKNPDRQVRLMVEAYRRQKNEFVAKVRPIIDELKASGVKTLSEIALCLTRRGIPTRTGKTVWFGSTVKAVIG